MKLNVPGEGEVEIDTRWRVDAGFRAYREIAWSPGVELPPVPQGFYRLVECRPDGSTVVIDREIAGHHPPGAEYAAPTHFDPL